mmetsp:Transcript_28955/g.63848  ORF Transcript_28955/g.63848 Transcript_28955/m.63848 type:complete len:310 (+) Transcript_28955:118-1047(+)
MSGNGAQYQGDDLEGLGDYIGELQGLLSNEDLSNAEYAKWKPNNVSEQSIPASVEHQAADMKSSAKGNDKPAQGPAPGNSDASAVVSQQSASQLSHGQVPLAMLGMKGQHGLGSSLAQPFPGVPPFQPQGTSGGQMQALHQVIPPEQLLLLHQQYSSYVQQQQLLLMHFQHLEGLKQQLQQLLQAPAGPSGAPLLAPPVSLPGVKAGIGASSSTTTTSSPRDQQLLPSTVGRNAVDGVLFPPMSVNPHQHLQQLQQQGGSADQQRQQQQQQQHTTWRGASPRGSAAALPPLPSRSTATPHKAHSAPATM